MRRLAAAAALAIALVGIGAAVQPAAASWACVAVDAANVGACVHNPVPNGQAPIPIDRPGPHPLLPD